MHSFIHSFIVQRMSVFGTTRNESGTGSKTNAFISQQPWDTGKMWIGVLAQSGSGRPTSPGKVSWDDNWGSIQFQDAIMKTTLLTITDTGAGENRVRARRWHSGSETHWANGAEKNLESKRYQQHPETALPVSPALSFPFFFFFENQASVA